MRRLLMIMWTMVLGFSVMLPHAQGRRHQMTPEQTAQRASTRRAAFLRARLAYMYQHPGVSVVEDATLPPEPDSDDIFPEARLVRFSDGATGVEISLHPQLTPEYQEQTSFIAVNRAQKTYRTFQFQSSVPTADEKNRVRQYLAARPHALGAPAPDPWASDTPRLRRAAFTDALSSRPTPARSLNAFSPRRSAPQYDGCSGFFFTGIWTVEAALQATALDYIEADWGDTGDNWWAYGNIYAWAANPVPLPPPFNTHWFVDYEFPYYDPFPYWGTAWSQDDAQFHNDDFPLNIGRVFTNAGGHIDFEYGQKFGGVYWYASGSWTASYLYGQLQAGGSDGCYYGF